MTSLRDILERARASGQKLPAGETVWLFAAATRLAAAQNATIRSRLVQMEPSGALQIARFDESRPEEEMGYLAPELLEPKAPRKNEPRVQVYAAGALGYELLTGGPPPDPRKGPGPELAGPVGDIVRMAMARDRRERFADLRQLRDALEALQRPPPAESERHAFAALLARSEKWAGVSEMDRAALAKLIEQVTQLGKQMEAVRAGMADVQRDQRDLQARVDGMQTGRERLVVGRAPRSSKIAGGFLGAVVAASVLYGAGLLRLPRLDAGVGRRLVERERTASEARAQPVPAAIAATPVAPATATPTGTGNSSSSATPTGTGNSSSSATPTATGNSTSTSNATPTATGNSTLTSNATPNPIANANSTPAPSSTATATSTAAAKPNSPAEKVSPAEMARSIAEAQVQRGDSELERGRYDAAVEEFQLALANDPTLPTAWRGLGIAHLMRHDEESARKAYEKYLQLSPAAPDARDIRRAIGELKARAKIGAGLEK